MFSYHKTIHSYFRKNQNTPSNKGTLENTHNSTHLKSLILVLMVPNPFLCMYHYSARSGIIACILGYVFFIAPAAEQITPILSGLKQQTFTVNPHYSCILYLRTYSLKLICKPKINTWSAFMVICRQVQSKENFRLPYTHIPSWDWTRWCSAFLFQLSYRKCVLFVSTSWRFFSHFCTFLVLVISLCCRGPCAAPKHCRMLMLTFLHAERLWRPYRENPCDW